MGENGSRNHLAIRCVMLLGVKMTRFNDLSVEEVEQFKEALKEVFDRHSVDEFYLGRIGLAISFDNEWYPFVGKTRGYNRESDRRFIEDGVSLLDRIVKLLKKEWTHTGGRTGGRVFITLSGVKRIDSSGAEIDLCTWDWPGKRK